MTENEDFPRGRIPSSKQPTIFPNRATALPKGNTKKNDRKRKRSISPDNSNFKDSNELFSTAADGLTYKKVQEEMLLLGCIRAISPLSLDVELPGKMAGKIRINTISQSFLKILHEEYKREDVEEGKDMARLSSMFQIGDYVPTKVIEKSDDADRTVIILSMDPVHINSDWTHTAFKKGLLLWAAVSSKLEHGYLLDAGIAHARIFLHNKNIEEDTTLIIGQPLWCVVQECEITPSESTLQTSILKKHVQSAMQDEMSLHYLVPGMQFNFRISKTVKYGLQGEFMNHCVGYVSDSYSAKASYRPEQIVKAWLLYIEPTTKFGYFTLKSIYSIPNPEYVKGKILRAQIISKTGGGLHIRLPNKEKAFVSNRRLFRMLPKNNNLSENISKRFRTDSYQQCRILDYNCMEDVYIATFEPLVLQEKYFTESDVKIGELITVKVIKITNEGLQVSFGKLKGFIHNIHLSNARFSENIKKRFSVGKSLQARVLSIDEKGIYFTHKQELVNSDVCLSSYNDAVVNQQYPGVIVNKSPQGVLVVFYGDVRGMLSNKYLLKMYPDYTDDMYYKGQVILTTVSRVIDDFLHLTLNPPKEPKSKSFQVGEYVKAVVTGIIKDGLLVEVQSYNTKAFVPTAHLSSSLKLTPLLLETYQVGDGIKDLLCLSTKGTPILSIRESFAYKSQNLDIIQNKDLKVGSLIRCSYEKSDKSAIYVSTPFVSKSVNIKIPKKHFLDQGKKINSSEFQPQQALVVKVLEVDKNHKINATAKLSEVFDGNYEYSLDLLQQYLRDMEQIRRHLLKNASPLTEFHLGQRVECKVSTVTEYGCKVFLRNGMKGLVSPKHYLTKVKPGEKLMGVILFVNYTENYVEISLNEKVIEKVNEIQDGIISKKLGLSSQAHVLIENPEYVIAVLQHEVTNGQLIFLPPKSHENVLTTQIEGKELSKIKVLIHSKINDKLIGMDKGEIHRLKKEQTMKRKRVLYKESSTKRGRFNSDINKNVKEEFNSEMEEEDSYMEDEAKITASSPINSDDTDANEEDNENGCEEEDDNGSVEESEQEVEETIQNGHDTDEDVGDEEQIQNYDNFSSEEEQEENVKEDAINHNLENENDLSSDKISVSQKVIPALPGVKNFFDIPKVSYKEEESSSDEDTPETKTKEKKKKKLTPAERKQMAKLEEEELIKKENENADLNADPQTVEQFQKLVKAKPNCSNIWSKYIAHLVSNAEIEKAKAVAQEALQTIHMELSQERFNIWVTRLHLENNYGDKNSFDEVFDEAVRCNDALKIYRVVIQMLADSQKSIEMEEKIKKAKNKFGREDQNLWEEIGRIYYQNGQLKEARNVKDAALLKLRMKSSQTALVVKFAMMEFQYGEKNQGEALFETILQHDPKRVDVWSTYVDQVIKQNDLDAARRILQRAVSQSIPKKKLKTLFIKYKEFETKHGSKEDVQQVIMLAKRCAAGLD